MVDKKLLDTVLALAKSQKEAYAPPPGAMPPPGMDPAAMGAMPPAPVPGMPAAGAMPPPGMDPAAMGAAPMPPAPGGMPMDPSQMGAMPPMDPSQMGAPPPDAGSGAVPIMMSSEDLMGLVQMAAQGAGGTTGGPGAEEQDMTAGPDTGESKYLSNKKLLAALEERISGLEDMLAQMMNAMGIQVPEKQMSMPGTSPEDVSSMGAGGPPPADAMTGGMPEPASPSDMNPMAPPPLGMKTASQHGTHSLSEAMRRMRLINSYRE